MIQDPRLRRDVTAATSSWNEKPASQQQPSSTLPPRELTEVARTLAAYGGQAVAFDLALDLVLNEVVEHARVATGATGAAVALSRNEAMECRATTGQDAPDLGVKVETESGLSGACLRTGEVQNCSDTEADPRVDPEACRQLGIRSILIFPLKDEGKAFGILEVFSSRPNAFGLKDIETLKELASKVVSSKSEAEQGASGARARVESEPYRAATTEIVPAKQSLPEPLIFASEDTELARTSDLLTTVLVVLVIVTAVTLGILIGWRGAAKRAFNGQTRVKTTSVEAAAASAQTPAPSQEPNASNPAPVSDGSSAPAQRRSTPTVSTSAPMGGLLVTENGKVIYRSQAAATSTVSAAPAGSLIHRVEPEYPASAKSQHIQGPVVLDVQVLSDGSVGTIAIVSGDPTLTEAAVHAVRKWKYQPNVVNGRPVESQTRVTINFSLPPTS